MKASEIENLSLEDLQDKIDDYKKQLLDLNMNNAVSPLENQLQIKMARRTVSRLLTSLTAMKKEIIA